MNSTANDTHKSSDSADTAPTIVVRHLTKTYGSKRALSDVSFDVQPGENFGLIGPNGAGKTTLLGLMLALLEPDSGTIEIAGAPADSLSARKSTGYMPERLRFESWMTPQQFLAYHHELALQPAKSRASDVTEVMEQVRLERDCWSRQIKSFSRGMLQRLGIAQALIGKPSILFLDEPTSGIDPTGAAIVLETLKSLRSSGVTVVINSHQLEHVESICDRVGFMQFGVLKSIEVLRTEQSAALFVIKWLTDDVATATEEQVAKIASMTGARLKIFSDGIAKFAIDNSKSKAALVAAMVAANIPVFESADERDRLAALFKEAQPQPGENPFTSSAFKDQYSK